MPRVRQKEKGNGRYGGVGRVRTFPIIYLRPGGIRIPATTKQKKKE